MEVKAEGIFTDLVAFEGVDDKAVRLLVVFQLHLSSVKVLLQRVAHPRRLSGSAVFIDNRFPELLSGLLEIQRQLEKLLFLEPDKGLGSSGLRNQPEGTTAGLPESLGGHGPSSAQLVANFALCHAAMIVADT